MEIPFNLQDKVGDIVTPLAFKALHIMAQKGLASVLKVYRSSGLTTFETLMRLIRDDIVPLRVTFICITLEYLLLFSKE